MRSASIVGAGWLGLPLGKSLLQSGFSVLGSTTQDDKLSQLREQGFEAHKLRFSPEPEGDLTALLNAEILIITLPPRQSEDFFAQVLQNLLHTAQKSSISKVIFTSATSVYPDLDREVTEKDAQMVVSPHSGVRFLAMENIIREHFAERATILRFGGLFGPHRQPCRFLSGKSQVAGANCPVNMVHLDDCIAAIQKVIQQEAWGEIFNVVNPDHPSRRNFYKKACLLTGSPPPTWSDEPKAWKKVSSAHLIQRLNFQFHPLFPQ